MNAELYSELKEEKAIHSGMIPKKIIASIACPEEFKNTNRPPQHVAK
jgi:hypothetical protein